MPPAASIPLTQALAILDEDSPPLAKSLMAGGEVRRFLFEAGGLDLPVTPAKIEALFNSATPLPASEDDLFQRLRRLKEEVFIRLALRDLLGLADLDEVLAGLSRLAELALEEAVRSGLDLLLKKKGLPPWPLGEPLFFAVLGMGKLGGRELNSASDVDLIYLHEPDLWPFGERIPAVELAAALGSLVGRALAQVTADGLVFRVDLDLRPAGKDGPLTPSLAGASHHYIYHAADWERLALIKARPVAGNLGLGRELLDETRPFVYRRHLDYTALEELRLLKARIATRPRSRTAGGFDLKLDRAASARWSSSPRPSSSSTAAVTPSSGPAPP
jgi:glutamate-ammonia-ligase adenylyltransferase